VNMEGGRTGPKISLGSNNMDLLRWLGKYTVMNMTLCQTRVWSDQGFLKLSLGPVVLYAYLETHYSAILRNKKLLLFKIFGNAGDARTATL
jgi:hypothetical protein